MATFFPLVRCTVLGRSRLFSRYQGIKGLFLLNTDKCLYNVYVGKQYWVTSHIWQIPVWSGLIYFPCYPLCIKLIAVNEQSENCMHDICELQSPVTKNPDSSLVLDYICHYRIMIIVDMQNKRICLDMTDYSFISMS